MPNNEVLFLNPELEFSPAAFLQPQRKSIFLNEDLLAIFALRERIN
jgi:hypothetical protein